MLSARIVMRRVDQSAALQSILHARREPAADAAGNIVLRSRLMLSGGRRISLYPHLISHISKSASPKMAHQPNALKM